jgi:hypothetical protein
MNALRTILSALGESIAPDGTMAKMRVRTTLDMLLTLAVTLLAVALTVGYQVFGRWARRQNPPD